MYNMYQHRTCTNPTMRGSTSAEGDSRRYSQNLSLCCRKTVSTNHLRILLLKSR